MVGFNEKRKQGKQASLSILGVKLQSPGRQRLWRQEPYPPYYSARYSPSIPAAPYANAVLGLCPPAPKGLPRGGVSVCLGLFDFDLGAFSLQLGLDLLGIGL